jgi:hypothetical protein
VQVWGRILSSEDGSAEVAAYSSMVEAHARRFSRLPDLESHFDDLVQEGLLAVWKVQAAGFPPSNQVVENAMRDYARVELRRGLTGYDDTDVDRLPDGSESDGGLLERL